MNVVWSDRNWCYCNERKGILQIEAIQFTFVLRLLLFHITERSSGFQEILFLTNTQLKLPKNLWLLFGYDSLLRSSNEIIGKSELSFDKRKKSIEYFAKRYFLRWERYLNCKCFCCLPAGVFAKQRERCEVWLMFSLSS